MAQLVEHLTLDFSSGHDFGSDRDFTVVRSSPMLGSVLTEQSLLGILSPSLSAPPEHSLSLSLSK